MAQFNIENDLEQSFFTLLKSQSLADLIVENDLLPIFNDFNSFNPSILNSFTYSKQSFPTINSSKKINREKLKIVYSELLQLLLEMVIDLIFKSIDWISLGVNWIKLDKQVEISIH